MGSWRFFNQSVLGANSVCVEWFTVHHDDGPSKACCGFQTLPACMDDAAREGFAHDDQVVYHMDMANTT